MKNKSMEKDIIKKIYSFEKERIYKTILFSVGFFILFFTVFITAFVSAYSILKEQKTLDVLILFTQPFEVIKENVNDVIEVLYIETPKNYIILIVVSFIFLLAIILYFIKNKGKIITRIKKIYKYFKK